MSFTPPEIKPIEKQKEFRYWCQKVLPEIYDDSLSYSELLGKVMVKLNEALTTINGYTDIINRIDDEHKTLVNMLRSLAEEIARELHDLGVALDTKQERLIAGAGITITGNVISATGGTGNVESVNGKTGRVVLNANDVGALPTGYHDSTKQNVITDLQSIRRGADLGSTALQSVPDTYRTSEEQDRIDAALSDRINNIELSKFPNAVIVGEPLIVGSNVSRFSQDNYMVFPFVVDVRGYPFVIDFCFRTGADVTTQQNILDSRFGFALAIQNGKGLMAMSSDGSSWNIGTSVGQMAITANQVYYARLSWDGTAYTTAISVDGNVFTNDMRIASTSGLFPTAMYIGGSPNLFGAGSAHPFSGVIDMSKAKLTVGGLIVWEGMSDPGLASRANVSLSNLDALGLEKFRAENIGYTAGGVDSDVSTELTEINRALSELETTVDDKYTKPTTGIPETDLSQDVQQKLNSGGGGSSWRLLADVTTEADASTVDFEIPPGTQSVIFEVLIASANGGNYYLVTHGTASINERYVSTSTNLTDGVRTCMTLAVEIVNDTIAYLTCSKYYKGNENTIQAGIDSGRVPHFVIGDDHIIGLHHTWGVKAGTNIKVWVR